MNRRAQSWSMDVVLAVVIFGFIAVTVTSFALLDQPDVQGLQQDAQQVSSGLAKPLTLCGGSQVLSNNALDPSAVDCLYNQNYTDLKQGFKTEEDFCIYLEDEDGRVIQVANKSGIGSPRVNISGTPCGQE